MAIFEKDCGCPWGLAIDHHLSTCQSYKGDYAYFAKYEKPTPPPVILPKPFAVMPAESKTYVTSPAGDVPLGTSGVKTVKDGVQFVWELKAGWWKVVEMQSVKPLIQLDTAWSDPDHDIVKDIKDYKAAMEKASPLESGCFCLGSAHESYCPEGAECECSGPVHAASCELSQSNEEPLPLEDQIVPQDPDEDPCACLIPHMVSCPLFEQKPISASKHKEPKITLLSAADVLESGLMAKPIPSPEPEISGAGVPYPAMTPAGPQATIGDVLQPGAVSFRVPVGTVQTMADAVCDLARDFAKAGQYTADDVPTLHVKVKIGEMFQAAKSVYLTGEEPYEEIVPSKLMAWALDTFFAEFEEATEEVKLLKQKTTAAQAADKAEMAKSKPTPVTTLVKSFKDWGWEMVQVGNDPWGVWPKQYKREMQLLFYHLNYSLKVPGFQNSDEMLGWVSAQVHDLVDEWISVEVVCAPFEQLPSALLPGEQYVPEWDCTWQSPNASQIHYAKAGSTVTNQGSKGWRLQPATRVVIKNALHTTLPAKMFPGQTVHTLPPGAEFHFSDGGVHVVTTGQVVMNLGDKPWTFVPISPTPKAKKHSWSGASIHGAWTDEFSQFTHTKVPVQLFHVSGEPYKVASYNGSPIFFESAPDSFVPDTNFAGPMDIESTVSDLKSAVDSASMATTDLSDSALTKMAEHLNKALSGASDAAQVAGELLTKVGKVAGEITLPQPPETQAQKIANALAGLGLAPTTVDSAAEVPIPLVELATPAEKVVPTPEQAVVHMTAGAANFIPKYLDPGASVAINGWAHLQSGVSDWWVNDGEFINGGTHQMVIQWDHVIHLDGLIDVDPEAGLFAVATPDAAKTFSYPVNTVIKKHSASGVWASVATLTKKEMTPKFGLVGGAGAPGTVRIFIKGVPLVDAGPGTKVYHSQHVSSMGAMAKYFHTPGVGWMFLNQEGTKAVDSQVLINAMEAQIKAGGWVPELLTMVAVPHPSAASMSGMGLVSKSHGHVPIGGVVATADDIVGAIETLVKQKGIYITAPLVKAGNLLADVDFHSVTKPMKKAGFKGTTKSAFIQYLTEQAKALGAAEAAQEALKGWQPQIALPKGQGKSYATLAAEVDQSVAAEWSALQEDEKACPATLSGDSKAFVESIKGVSPKSEEQVPAGTYTYVTAVSGGLCVVEVAADGTGVKTTPFGKKQILSAAAVYDHSQYKPKWQLKPPTPPVQLGLLTYAPDTGYTTPYQGHIPSVSIAADAKAFIKAISAQFGDGKVVGKGLSGMSTVDMIEWLRLWDEGDLKGVYALEDSKLVKSPHTNHPGAPHNNHTHIVQWAPAVAGEIPAGVVVMPYVDPAFKWPTGWVDAYLLKAQMQHPTHLLPFHREMWVKAHQAKQKFKVDRLSKLAVDHWHSGLTPVSALPVTPEGELEKPKAYTAFVEGKFPVTSWSTAAMVAFNAEHNLVDSGMINWTQLAKAIDKFIKQGGVAEETKAATADDTLVFTDMQDESLLSVGTNAGICLVSDQFGGQWVWKPAKNTESWRANVEHGALLLSRLWGFNAPDSKLVEYKGKKGQVQRRIAAVHSLTGVDLKDLSTKQLSQVASEHVLDWAMGNDDSHRENFLVSPDGEIVGIDKGRAYRNFGVWPGLTSKDSMNTNTHVVYAELYYRIKKGAFPEDTVAAMYKAARSKAAKMQALSDVKMREALEIAFEGRPFGDDKGPSTKDKLIQSALNRKNSLKADIDSLWSEIYEKSAFDKPTTPNPLINPQGHSVHTGFGPEFLADVALTKSFGTTSFVAGTQVEDGMVLVWREKLPDGTFRLRAQLQLRGSAIATVENYLEARVTGDSSSPTNLPFEQHWYNSIILAAKTVSYHAQDKTYNEDTLSQFHETKVALSQALPGYEESGDGSAVEMVKKYLAYAQAIEMHKEAGTKSHIGEFPRHSYVAPVKESTQPVAVEPTVIKVDATSWKSGMWEAGLDDAGELKLGAGGADTDCNPGMMYEVTLPSGEKLEYRGKNHTGTAKAHEGLVRFSAPEVDGAVGMERLKVQMAAMGVELLEADDVEMELLYWRTMANIMRQRCDAKPGGGTGYYATAKAKSDHAKYQKVWAKVDKNVENSGGMVELEMWRAAMAEVTSSEQIESFTAAGGHLPRFSHFDIYNPQQPNGKPYWERWDMEDSDWIDQDFPSASSGFSKFASQIVRTGGAYSSDARMRALGLAVGETSMSSMSDMQYGSSGFVFTRLRRMKYVLSGDASVSVMYNPRVLKRHSNFSFNEDHFGNLDIRHLEAPFSPAAVSQFDNSGNETMIKDALSLLDDIEILAFNSDGDRLEAIGKLAKLGITDIRGLSVADRFVVWGGKYDEDALAKIDQAVKKAKEALKSAQ